jgi:hypothetical protein
LARTLLLKRQPGERTALASGRVREAPGAKRLKREPLGAAGAVLRTATRARVARVALRSISGWAGDKNLRRFAALYSERLRSLRGHLDIAHIMRAKPDGAPRGNAAPALRIMIRALC